MQAWSCLRVCAYRSQIVTSPLVVSVSLSYWGPVYEHTPAIISKSVRASEYTASHTRTHVHTVTQEMERMKERNLRKRSRVT